MSVCVCVYVCVCKGQRDGGKCVCGDRRSNLHSFFLPLCLPAAINNSHTYIYIHTRTHTQVRLAWHDAGSYNAKTNKGGADGSIRFEKEFSNGGYKTDIHTYTQT